MFRTHPEYRGSLIETTIVSGGYEVFFCEKSTFAPASSWHRLEGPYESEGEAIGAAQDAIDSLLDSAAERDEAVKDIMTTTARLCVIMGMHLRSTNCSLSLSDRHEMDFLIKEAQFFLDTFQKLESHPSDKSDGNS